MLLKAFLFLVASFWILLVYAADMDVVQFGAVGDGKTVNTMAIQKAIDSCSKQGGGNVVFSKGTWVSGTILLKTNVYLFLSEEATLLGSTDSNDYQLVEGFKDGRGSAMGFSFIGAKEVTNCGIKGKGRINGNGKILLEKNGKSKRPFLIRFVRCSHVTVSDVLMEGPAAWTMHLFECKKVKVERVGIRSRGLSNNDGIDIDCCEEVVVNDCDIDSGDDAICLKTTGPLPCKNIEVYHCKINTDQAAFKLGTESVGNFEDINIHDCMVRNTKGIKLHSVDGAQVKNLRISNITIAKTTLPVFIRLGARLKTFREGDIKKSIGSIDGISINNLSVESATQMAILISGIPNSLIKNIQVMNMSVRLPGKGTVAQAEVTLPEVEAEYPEVTMFGKDMPAFGIYLRHAEHVSLRNVKVKLDSADARPAIVGVDLQNVQLDGFEMPSTTSSEPFINLETVKDVSITNLHPSATPATYLGVKGKVSGIVLQANKPKLLLGPGVNRNAIKIMKESK